MVIKTTRKIIAVIMTICMAAGLCCIPQLSTNVYAAEGKTAGEAPDWAVFETDFSKLVQQWRRYARISYGTEGKEWLACGIEDNALVLLCDPGNCYPETDFGETVNYEESNVDNALQKMTQDSSEEFTASEKKLMKPVEISLGYSQGTVERKLYAPYPNGTTMKVGGGDSWGNITLSLADSELKTSTFWTRGASMLNAYYYSNGEMIVGQKTDRAAVAPVMHLDLASDTAKPVFVSAAEPAKADAAIASTAKYPSPENTTLTMRYDGTDRISYNAYYNSEKVYATTEKAAENEYLYVQWSVNHRCYVKSFALKNTEGAAGMSFTEEEIGGSDFALSKDVKVWIEKKTDNLTYAKTATNIKDTGPAAPEGLTATRSTNGKADGAINGLNPELSYEYVKTSKDEKWIAVSEGATEITGLRSGNYRVRIRETDTQNPGMSTAIRVKDIYDVTVSENPDKVMINEQDISSYPAFGKVSVVISYAKDAVLNTLDKLTDFDAEDVSDMISKYATDSNEKSAEAERLLKKTQENLKNVTAETDACTKGILGEINSEELNREIKNATDAVSRISSTYYGEIKSRIGNIDRFYNGEMTDNSAMESIDGDLNYFYSPEKISYVTGKNISATSEEKFCEDFISFGDTLLKAAPNGKNGQDIFTLYEGACSHVCNFNDEAFTDRENLYDGVMDFYEKGYSVVASSIAYDITNHQDMLTKLDALHTAANDAETEAESLKIQESIYSIAKACGYQNSAIGWRNLEKNCYDQISKGKESLRTLKSQHEALRTAYTKAKEKLAAEKEKYDSDSIITCYRNQTKYNAELEILSVNDPYVEDFKSTKLPDFFEYKTTLEGTLRVGEFRPKYRSADLSNDKAKVRINDLESISEWAENRGMSLEEQIGKAFSYYDATAECNVKYSRFTSDSRHSSTIGYYINGWQNKETQGDDVYFKRNVSYFRNGKTAVYCSASKGWYGHMYENEAKEGKIKSNDVSGAYVIHLNRVIETPGSGGGDACFIAKGRAVKSTNRISWNEVDDASGYDVYYARCEKSMKKVATTKKLSYTRKNLSRGANYTYKVKAYTLVNGKKKYIAATPAIHIAGVKTKHSNALSVKFNKDSLNLTTGSTAKLTCKVTKKSSSKSVLWKNHVKSRIRYMSSDKNIATVNSKGKITAKAAGTVYIYGYAASGASAWIEVTVAADGLPTVESLE